MTEKKAVLTEALLQRLMQHGEDQYPEECCGLLFGTARPDGTVLIRKTVPMKNQVVGRNTHYGINPLELHRREVESQGEGLEILGFYHSHPDCPAVPSEEDRREMLPGMLYLILSVRDGKTDGLRGWEKDLRSKEMTEAEI